MMVLVDEYDIFNDIRFTIFWIKSQKFKEYLKICYVWVLNFWKLIFILTIKLKKFRCKDFCFNILIYKNCYTILCPQWIMENESKTSTWDIHFLYQTNRHHNFQDKKVEMQENNKNSFILYKELYIYEITCISNRIGIGLLIFYRYSVLNETVEWIIEKFLWCSW